MQKIIHINYEKNVNDDLMREKSPSSVLMTICDVLKIAPTGRRILEILAQKEGKLSIKEIIARIGRSERAIRAHLKNLLSLNLVKREAYVTKHNRIAHLYFLPAMEDMIKSAKREIEKRLHELERSMR